MKLPSPISMLQFRAGRQPAAARTGAIGNAGLAIGPGGSRRGVALIITLIMLSVITFMAVTFLVLSQRERKSANTATDQLVARITADSALQRAQTELLAPMLALTNDQAVDLIVSTNYVNRYGYDPAAPLSVPSSIGSNPTNVNYFYQLTPAQNPLTLNQPLQNLANLLFNPRPPVFVTNRSGGTDFPYYLDLNRNGIADTNGWWPVITNGEVVVTGVVTNYSYFTGDPEWIGVLERPDQPHSSSNKFVARYAYLVVPTSQTLDLNYIHNYAAVGTDPNGLQYRRNMGMGGWENNLASFLVDLNTNEWGRLLYGDPGFFGTYYKYLPLQAPDGVAGGIAFEDAQALLNYRYAGFGLTPWNNVQSVLGLFGNAPSPGTPTIRNDLSDEYGGGPYMTGTRLPLFDGDNASRFQSGWPGSDNPNHFFTPQDLYDTGKIPPPGFAQPGFVARLSEAGTKAAGLTNSSYDRYTFYRLLSQLGTDSVPDQNKMNVNYRNMSNGIVVVGMETNFIPWRPLEFFTNAAQKMFGQLRLPDPTDPTGFRRIDISNIPIFPANTYTPVVHRVLQLAANMYDATTFTNTPYPSIFRPVFSRRNGTDIVITGYELVNAPEDTATSATFLTTPLDVLDPTERANIVSSPPGCNVYGVPWIIGAKKGLPNLNQVAMESITTISRRIQVTNTSPADTGLDRLRFTQMIEVGISNQIGVQIWNSYSNAYPRPLFVQADGDLTMLLSNIDVGFRYGPFKYKPGGPGFGSTNLAANQLRGTGWVPTFPGRDRPPNALSFQIPLLTNLTFLQFAQYRQAPPTLSVLTANKPLDFSQNAFNAFPQPHWILFVTNRLRCMIVDGGAPPNGRVVDYVQLGGLDTVRDLSAESSTDDRFGMFRTNMAMFGPFNIPEGVQNQIMMSLGIPPDVDQATWADYGGLNIRDDEVQKFTQYMYGTSQTPVAAAQVPFTPSAKRYQTLTWQANDPLVHYLASDMYPVPIDSTNLVNSSVVPSVTNNFYGWNKRYDPWNGRPNTGGSDSSDPYRYETGVKDPSIWSSDCWDFPTNKFPGIGWLGRVHRGTPWQTVYLKSTDMTRTNLAAWSDWTGTPISLAQRSAPVNDWGLFDLFTASINDNASRGRLSVNQTGLAAWSAVLGGVIALTNSGGGPAAVVIDPAGPFSPNLLPPVARIVQGINNARFFTNRFGAPLFRNHVFNQAGDVLAAPELTEHSPFLNATNLRSVNAGGITDAILERIPQQIMSLLTLNHSPRFVIYSYGQTLRPAERSLYLVGGPYFRMCTNYQVTAETATRAVVRVDGSFDPRNRPVLNGGIGPDQFGRLFPPHLVVEQFNVLPPD